MRPFMLNNSIRLIRPQSYQPFRPGQLGFGGMKRYPTVINNNFYGCDYTNSCWTDYRSSWDKTIDNIADVLNLATLGTDLAGEVLGWFGFGKSGDGSGGTT